MTWLENMVIKLVMSKVMILWHEIFRNNHVLDGSLRENGGFDYELCSLHISFDHYQWTIEGSYPSIKRT